MDFLCRPAGTVAHLGVLAGTFNPPTNAHLSLARAALDQVDAVVLVLPRLLPHKSYDHGAAFNDRCRMLRAAVSVQPRMAAAVTSGGLFYEIAEECREAYGPQLRLAFLCGRDAAERIINWDYGTDAAIDEILKGFNLLVAPRQGGYEPPARLRDRVRPLHLAEDLDEVSSSEVRRLIQAGGAWEHLVPEAVVPIAREAYLPL
ncbi:MAG: nicotinate-nicotinamide nucleotide adenylyltransferase [Bryobacteraceae bacterium]